MISYEDLDAVENNFTKNKDVKSFFLCGNKKYIENPLITVLIPTYKRPCLLEQALKSVVTQSYTDVFWDVLVLDNEPYEGYENYSGRLIRKLDNDRVLYYRNEKKLNVCDNFNRGILLSRGKWVMMLHDDDLLISNAVHRMAKLIKAYEKIDDKPLGAISAMFLQFRYDDKRNSVNKDLHGLNFFLTHKVPVNYELRKLNHRTVWFTSHIGGYVPSNGTTFNKEAIIKTGGFVEKFGIMSDLILLYNMESNYSVYATCMPLGFYRWGCNEMMQNESIHKIVKAGFDFREYVYSTRWWTRLLGSIMRRLHYYKFTGDVINDRNSVCMKKVSFDDFNYIFDKKPNKLLFAIYRVVVIGLYNLFQKNKMYSLSKKARKVMENE